MSVSAIKTGLIIALFAGVIFCGCEQAGAQNTKLFNSGKASSSDKPVSVNGMSPQQPSSPKSVNVTSEFDYEAAIAKDLETYEKNRNADQTKLENDNAARMKKIQDEYAEYFTAIQEQAEMKAAALNGGTAPTQKLVREQGQTAPAATNPYQGKKVIFKNKEDGETSPKRLFNIPKRD